MPTNHRVFIEMENRRSLRNASSMISLFAICVSFKRKTLTTLCLLVLSTMVKSNYCNNNNDLIILPLTSTLFIKFLIDAWSNWTKVGYPIM